MVYTERKPDVTASAVRLTQVREKHFEFLLEHLLEWQEAMDSAKYKTECLDSIIDNLRSSQSAERLTEMTEEERVWLLAKMVCIEDIRAQKALSEALWL